MSDLVPMMPRYEEYKDSGVKWLGEIPRHWELQRIKFLFKEINERSKYGIEDLLSVSQYKGITRRKDKFDNDENLITTARSLEGYKKVFKGDLVSNIMLAWNGSLGFSTYNGITSPAYSIYRLKVDAVEKYFHYLFPTEIYKAEFKRNSSGVIESRLRLYTEDFFDIWSLFPSLHEQTAIASFLDCKTTKIDQAMAIKEKQIQLLKERRQILIQTAVTKGLDSNVFIRDSGVEWIGEIPAHWDVKRAKYLFKEVDERSTTGKEELLSVSHMTGVTPRSEKNVTMFLAEDYTGSKTCQKNDLVFNIMWAWMGALGVTDKPGIVSSSYGIFRQQKDGQFNSNYLEFLLKTTKYIEHYNKVSTGLHSSRLRFYGHMFFNMEIGFPDRKEQDQIVTHIQTQSTKIDKAIAIQAQMIDKLKEYKATLINSAVTGKIKVPQTVETKAVA